MVISILIIALLIAAVFLFMQQAQFGKHPTAKRLERIEKSPNYKKGEFQNLNPTPVMAENASYMSALKEYFVDGLYGSPEVDKLTEGKVKLYQKSIRGRKSSAKVVISKNEEGEYMVECGGGQKVKSIKTTPR